MFGDGFSWSSVDGSPSCLEGEGCISLLWIFENLVGLEYF